MALQKDLFHFFWSVEVLPGCHGQNWTKTPCLFAVPSRLQNAIRPCYPIPLTNASHQSTEELCSFCCSQTVTLKSSPLTGRRRLSFIPSSRSLVGKKSLMTTSSPSKTRKFGVCAAPRAAENISTDLQNLLKSRLLSNYLLQNTKFIFACCFRSQLSKLSSYSL